MRSHYRGHKMAVWLNLIPQLHQPGDDDVSMRHHHFHEREQHYYAGVVRAESFTRLPPPLHPVAMLDPRLAASGENSECLTEQPSNSPNYDTTTASSSSSLDQHQVAEEESEMLQKLANRHYYSYTAALGVTVGVGCLLLVLNVLIFAGIYYQRGRDKKKGKKEGRMSRSSSSPSSESIPMSQRPTSASSASQSPRSASEPPPCYNALARAVQLPAEAPHHSSLKKDCRNPPRPPMRTSSNLSSAGCAAAGGGGQQAMPPGGGGGTVKKRVQIQEISV